jgi:LPS sulfotransferase NodH
MNTEYYNQDRTIYLIAFTLRSGSNLLCDYLLANRLGQPAEYFQYPFGETNRSVYDSLSVAPDDFPGFFRQLIAQRATGNIFGAKLTWDHKNAVVEQLQHHFQDVHDIPDLFPRCTWIYLLRQDRAAQAVSIWRATKSKQWRSTDSLPSKQNQEYDFFGILTRLYAILVEEYLWEDYFRNKAISPVRLYYEDLVEHAAAAIVEIARRLPSASIHEESEVKLVSNLSRQRDEYSEVLKARFLDDLYHVGAASHWGARTRQLQRWIDFFSQETWKNPS